MGRSKVIPLFDKRDPAMTRLLRAAENVPVVYSPLPVPAAAERRKRPFMLAYKSGDRCTGCGKSAFNIGRSVATCANPRCELPVPLG